MANINITVKDNGYKAEGLQEMIQSFNTAAAKLFPGCEVEHFYYGDNCSFSDIRLGNGHYGHFSISAKRVGLGGYTCTSGQLAAFKRMTYKDECYSGELLSLARA